MSTSYLDIVNEVLYEINEVPLTSANFASSTNIQRFVRAAVNRAYRDIHDEEHQWPWMVTGESSDQHLGNVYIETVAGQRWYDMKSSATEADDQYAHIDWDSFTLTEEGVSGKTAPYVVEHVPEVSMTDWKRYYSATENRDKSDTQTYGQPRRVMRYPNNTQFGLSPIPDEVYRIYFFAWDQLIALSDHDDTIVMPSVYLPVLMARIRYYVHQFKANTEDSRAALAEYKKGIKRMRYDLNPMDDYMTDNRTMAV